MEGAWITGYFSRFKKPSIVSALHFPFACTAFLALAAHTGPFNDDSSGDDSGLSSSSIEDDIPFSTFSSYFVIAIFVIGLTIYALFFFFHPIAPMDVNKYQTVWLSGSNKFSFLVVNYRNSSSIPPGSFFLIYANHHSNLSYFHAHSFPVFSSQNGRISFLIRCQIAQDEDQISFTQRLSLGKYPPLPPQSFPLPLSLNF